MAPDEAIITSYLVVLRISGSLSSDDHGHIAHVSSGNMASVVLKVSGQSPLTKRIVAYLLFVVLVVVVFLYHEPASAADCTARTETYMDRVPYACYTHSGWFFWRTSSSKICYRSVTKTRLRLNNCQGCGGCSYSVERQRACDVQVEKRVSYKSSYRTCTWHLFWKDCSTRYTTRYRTVATIDKYCCSGMTRIESQTCHACGRNRLGNALTMSAPVTAAPGDASSFIIGGHTAQPGQIPWQVWVQAGGLCGGSIIGSRWILTAAHCVYNDAPSSSSVYVGDYLSWETDRHEVRHDVDKFIVHPSYHHQSSASDYDIALIRTKNVIAFNDYVQPVCLPTEQRSYLGKKVVISGWGRTSPQGSVADVLKYTYATVVREKECTTRLNGVICAKGYSRSTPCFGDSGGPMTLTENGQATVIGVAWFVHGDCSVDHAFAYTDAGRYIKWIRDTMY